MVTVAFRIFLIACLAMLSLPAMACNCANSFSPQAQLDASSAVFSGKVVRIKWYEKTLQRMNRMNAYQIMIVTFQPSRVWKGQSMPEIDVETPDPENDDCGVDFKKDQEYLVYAVMKQRLETDACARTKLLSKADEDLQVLGTGREP